MKNANVVKQQFDNSCGSASLATILTYFYGAPISEKQVMDLIGKDAKTASFADLARVATQKGFGARGGDGFFHTCQNRCTKSTHQTIYATLNDNLYVEFANALPHAHNIACMGIKICHAFWHNHDGS